MAIKDLKQYSGLMTVKTTAEFLECDRRTVYRLIKKGYLTPVGRPGFLRFNPTQVLAGMKRMANEYRRTKITKGLIKDKKVNTVKENN